MAEGWVLKMAWAERHEITWQGETHSISEWAALRGMDRGTLSNRLNIRGMTVDEALSTPVRSRKRKPTPTGPICTTCDCEITGNVWRMYTRRGEPRELCLECFLHPNADVMVECGTKVHRWSGEVVAGKPEYERRIKTAV
jgi:hypothetical protein